jgi:hypothetical protein
LVTASGDMSKTSEGGVELSALVHASRDLRYTAVLRVTSSLADLAGPYRSRQ